MPNEFKQNTVALVYDFDGTLSPEPMQHYGVLPKLNVEPPKFWAEVKRLRKEHRAEELLMYMHEMVRIADASGVKLQREDLKELGSRIEYFPGVEDWFERINRYVAEKSNGAIKVEHYIISAGLKEIIEGCSIADQFEEIYACELFYDAYGHPKWPARVITDTSKTQYLFRVNKGVLDVNESINSHMPAEERKIPFDNMIYFGDGETDVPSMALMMQNGGHAVAVHKDEKGQNTCQDLRRANRIDYFCDADYSAGSQLEVMVQNTLDIIVSRIELRQRVFELPPRGKLT